MPRTCTTCTHPHRDEIDRRLLDGAPLWNIAKLFSISPASLFRLNKHISKHYRMLASKPKFSVQTA